jgi:hypothetical protein
MNLQMKLNKMTRKIIRFKIYRNSKAKHKIYLTLIKQTVDLKILVGLKVHLIYNYIDNSILTWYFSMIVDKIFYLEIKYITSMDKELISF